MMGTGTETERISGRGMIDQDSEEFCMGISEGVGWCDIPFTSVDLSESRGSKLNAKDRFADQLSMVLRLGLQTRLMKPISRATRSRSASYVVPFPRR